MAWFRLNLLEGFQRQWKHFLFYFLAVDSVKDTELVIDLDPTTEARVYA